MNTLDVQKATGITLNPQAVAGDGESVVVMSPKTVMSKTEALVHAAYLVAVADQSENFETFRGVLKAVLEA